MVAKTRKTRLGNAEQDPSQDFDEQTSRKVFIEVHNTAQCPACETTVQFILNGINNVGRQMVECKNCRKRISGNNLRAMIAAAKETVPARPTRKPASKSTAKNNTPNDEPTSVTFAALKLSNHKLLEQDNADLKAQHEAVLTKLQEAKDSTKTLQEDNKKLHQEIVELKNRISGLTTQVAKLVEKLSASEPVNKQGGNPTQAEPEAGKSSDENPEEETAETDGQDTEQEAVDPNPQLPNPATAKPLPLNCATVVKSGRKVLPKDLQARVQDSIQSLNSAGFQARRSRQSPKGLIQPKPVAVYFSNIPRGPIGELKKALLKCLPKWAILGISFIGSAITEILCHTSLVERLIATLQFFRYKHISAYNKIKMETDDAPPETQRQYKAACYRRWEKLGAQTPSPVCKAWYEGKAKDILDSDTGLDKVAPPKRKATQPTDPQDKVTTENENSEDGPNGTRSEPVNGSNAINDVEDELGSDDDIVDLTPSTADEPAEGEPTDN